MTVILLLAWLGLLTALLVFSVGQRGRGALTLAYFLSLSLIHVPGVLAFAAPGPEVSGREDTVLGFQLTLLGMGAYVAGTLLANHVYWRRPSRVPPDPRVQARTYERMGVRSIWVGAVCFFGLAPIASKIPSMTSLCSVMGALLILGLWLRLYGAGLVNDRAKRLQTLALLPMLPIATMLSNGIINYGVNWAIGVVAFLYVTARRRLAFIIAAPVVVVLGLSFFVVYMGERDGIRDTVWGRDAGVVERIQSASSIVSNFRLMDLQRPVDRGALAGRLNFNTFLGIGYRRHQQGRNELKYGGTVNVLALIPRAIWRDKPIVGGGGDLVTEFTGIWFDKSKISVGTGQALEFYMNFGVVGIVVGFLLTGFLFMWLDNGIAVALKACDFRRLVLLSMPGLNLSAPGGNLLETMVAVAAAIVASHLLVSLPYFRVASPKRVRAAETLRPRPPTLELG